ncbi:MAG: hypothetical protein H6706_20030 [Myxococcales bacterium]|nr:hypothetical protein [Myxococcales bacterium]
MKTVQNQTNAPIAVPLPGNKTLRIGPRGQGQIRDEAAAFGPLQKLVEAGTISLQAAGGRVGPTQAGNLPNLPTGRPGGRGGIRSSRGDR